MKSELFGGGLLGRGRNTLDALAFFANAKKWLDSYGIDFQQLGELGPAFNQIVASEDGESRLSAIQVFVKEFSQVTTKTDADDKFSEAMDSILQPGIVRDWAVNLLEKTLSESEPKEDGFQLPVQETPDLVVQELNFKGIDIDKVLEIIGIIANLLSMFRGR